MTTIKLIFLMFTLEAFKFSSGHFHWAEVYDGNCVDEDKLVPADLNLFWVFDATWTGWYVPLASRSFFYPYCHFLKDEGCLSDEEMSEMCLRMGSEDVGISFQLKNKGFNSEFSLDCSMENKYNQCHGEKLNKYGHTLKQNATIHVTYTDNNVMALTIRCQKHQSGRGRRSWSLLTTQPTITEKQRQMILEQVAALGFDPKKTVTLDYTACEGMDQMTY